MPQDDTEAVKWYRLAAAQGYDSAQSNLGVMYAKGQGVPQDDAEAMKWYRLAADQGDGRAQVNLGVLYGNGQGVRRNYVQGYMWLSLAAQQGDKGAVLIQGQIEREMTPDELAEAQRLTRSGRRRGND